MEGEKTGEQKHKGNENTLSSVVQEHLPLFLRDLEDSKYCQNIFSTLREGRDGSAEYRRELIEMAYLLRPHEIGKLAAGLKGIGRTDLAYVLGRIPDTERYRGLNTARAVLYDGRDGGDTSLETMVRRIREQIDSLPSSAPQKAIEAIRAYLDLRYPVSGEGE